MEWYLVLAVIGIGFLAGFINTLAGSGSLLSLPMLIFIGLPANIANGTNRIAILLQNAVASESFRRQKVLDFKIANKLAIPAIVGSILGANIAVELDEKAIKQIIGFLLIIMFFLILLKPSAWIKGKAKEYTSDHKLTLGKFLIFFMIGMYGGFIQAGTGLFLLAGLVLGNGLDLVKANAVKVFIAFSLTVFALIVFIVNDQVDYKVGLILAVGNMSGAFVASKFAVSWGTKFIRYVLLIVLLGSAIKIVYDVF